MSIMARKCRQDTNSQIAHKRSNNEQLVWFTASLDSRICWIQADVQKTNDDLLIYSVIYSVICNVWCIVAVAMGGGGGGQWIGSALVEIMACRLFGTKPLFKGGGGGGGQWIGSALVEIMACRLFGTKPLFKPILGYCQLDPLEQTFNQNRKLFIHENAFKIAYAKWQPFCPGEDRLSNHSGSKRFDIDSTKK